MAKINWKVTGPSAFSATLAYCTMTVDRTPSGPFGRDAVGPWHAQVSAPGKPVWKSEPLDSYHLAMEAAIEHATREMALPYLRSFTRDGFSNNEETAKREKATLKARKWVSYSHGFWHLTDAGREEAEKQGYL